MSDSYEDLVPEVVRRIDAGEVPTDDGWRLKPLWDKHLRSLVGQPSHRPVGIYSPSQLGGCKRKLFYTRLGLPMLDNTSPKGRMRMGVGTAVHKSLFNPMMQDMFGLDEMSVELVVSLDSMHIRGEADAVLLHVETGKPRRILDCKTINLNRFGRLKEPVIRKNGDVYPEEMKTYVWQLHAYMASANATLGTLFYICKDNSDTMEIPLVFSRPVWSQIENTIAEVEYAISVGKAPDYEPDAFFCPECNYWGHPCEPPGIFK